MDIKIYNKNKLYEIVEDLVRSFDEFDEDEILEAQSQSLEYFKDAIEDGEYEPYFNEGYIIYLENLRDEYDDEPAVHFELEEHEIEDDEDDEKIKLVEVTII